MIIHERLRQMKIGIYRLLIITIIVIMQSNYIYSKEIRAQTDWTKFDKLEGMTNQGKATITQQDTGVRIGGAVATPFPVGSVQSSVSAQVRSQGCQHKNGVEAI